jgi:hypothetical protein
MDNKNFFIEFINLDFKIIYIELYRAAGISLVILSKSALVCVTINLYYGQLAAVAMTIVRGTDH